RDRVVELGDEEIALCVEDLEVRGDAAVEPQVRGLLALAERDDVPPLDLADRDRPRNRVQAARSVAERGEGGLLVREARLIPARLRGVGGSPQAPALEDRREEVSAEVPDEGRRLQEVGEVRALEACAPRERELREEVRLGDPDLGVRGAEQLLRLAHVRPAL